MKRKCNFCSETTNKPLIDFHKIGWEAYSINRKKAICSCPKHKNKLRKLMKEEMEREE